MADTQRTLSALVALLADNTSQDISAQDLRDFLVSALIGRVTTYTASAPTLSTDDCVLLLDGTSNTVTVDLGDPADFTHRFFIAKAINIDSAVALDPGANNFEGATDDYVFATVLDAVVFASDGTAWHILGEFLNA